VPRDAGDRRDPEHHPVDVSSVDGLAGGRPQDQWPVGALSAAGLEDPKDRDGDGHGDGLVAFADQVQDTVPAQCLGVVLDPDRGCLRCPERVDAEQER
jgi:hypothetical protein